MKPDRGALLIFALTFAVIVIEAIAIEFAKR